MARPKGRRTWHKIALFDSELEALLELCAPGATDIARVAGLCRDIACGEWRVVEADNVVTSKPRELVRARAERAPGRRGRTPIARTRRDVLLFPLEYEAFMKAVPEGVPFADVLRGLASGALRLVPDPEGRKRRSERVAGGRCDLCGRARTDAAPYCLSCRTDQPAVASAA